MKKTEISNTLLLFTVNLSEWGVLGYAVFHMKWWMVALGWFIYELVFLEIMFKFDPSLTISNAKHVEREMKLTWGPYLFGLNLGLILILNRVFEAGNH